MTMRLTRRRLLAGVGAAGGTLGMATALSQPSRGYTHATHTGRDSESGSSPRLWVAWWETHNGSPVRSQGGRAENATEALDTDTTPTYVPDATGPVVQATDLLPGDTGRLGIGVRADLPGQNAIALWYRLKVTAERENGVNEPELSAGDEPGNGPELGDRLRLTAWEDTGLVGACDGELTPGTETPVEEGEGSLDDVVASFSGGRRFPDCLTDGETRCLGLAWRLPADDPTINVVQGDAVTFSIEFRPAPCESGTATNPFGGDGDA